MDIAQIAQAIAIIAGSFFLASLVNLSIRLFNASPTAYTSAHRKADGWKKVFRGEVDPRSAHRLDPEIECGLTVEERIGPKGERYAVLLRQGKLSRDTMMNLLGD